MNFGLLTNTEYKVISSSSNFGNINAYELNLFGEISYEFGKVTYLYNSYYVSKDGNNAMITSGYYVRPAIVIKGDIKVSSGDGTINNPYVVS